jgi:hypothetical protein
LKTWYSKTRHKEWGKGNNVPLNIYNWNSCPVRVSCNEFAGTPMEALVDGLLVAVGRPICICALIIMTVPSAVDSCKIYQIINGMLWDKQIPKQYRTTICKIRVYCKSILTYEYNTDTWTLTKRRKRNPSNEFDIFLRST